MPDYQLESEPFLGGYRKQFQDTVLKEVTNLAIVSVACPLGHGAELASAVRNSWSTELPVAGRTASSAGRQVTLLNMSPDQYFVLFEAGSTSPKEAVSDKLRGTGYLTDQSDNWVALRISGGLSLKALERICPIDLDSTVFPDGAVARTVMEHLGTIILREGPSRFLLLSASSSAHSFLHAVETSLNNVMESPD